MPAGRKRRRRGQLWLHAASAVLCRLGAACCGSRGLPGAQVRGGRA
jgi:hypothetical protein